METKSLTIHDTITLDDARQVDWDVVVIGAGPAGSIAARELARHGCRVLLVDKRNFPRPKVCGACLSRHALDALEFVGLSGIPKELGGSQYDRFQLCSRGRSATVQLPAGVAVSRDSFDERLVKEAMSRNVSFLPATTASLEASSPDTRQILLTQPDQDSLVSARIVVTADGVGGQVLTRVDDAEIQTWEQSRIGAAASIQSDELKLPNSAIHMGVSQNGYVGIVRIENNQLNFAAALDKQFVRRCGTLGRAAQQVLSESGMDFEEKIADANWRGTTKLTRRPRRVGFHRLFAIGDSAGYAEPFTGEGMAWAMTSAIMVVPFVLEAIREWSPQVASRWSAAHRRTIRGRQNACYRLATWLRYPHLVHSAVIILSMFPWLADPFVRRINRSAEGIFQ